MASYDGLLAASVEQEQPWPYRRCHIADAWVSEDRSPLISLMGSFTGNFSDGDVFSPEMVDSLLSKPDFASPARTPTVSGCLENEASPWKQRQSGPPPNGRIAKRRARPSKKRASTTTFITADPVDFRRMVQQVTGVRFGNHDGAPPMALAWDTEQLRELNAVETGVGLSTLDTSLFLVNGSAAPMNGGGAAVTRSYLEPFCSFPTLESWEAV